MSGGNFIFEEILVGVTSFDDVLSIDPYSCFFKKSKELVLVSID
jgi:hypothetical protein